MDELNSQDIQECLKLSRLGFWKVEIKEGEGSKFYADKVMNELLGTSVDMTPEERFVFHREHIHEDDLEMFLEYSDKLSHERAEIVYRYIHPISGEMYVRCGGKKDESETGHISIVGIHQDISDTVRMEKDKLAEQRLAELNQSLRKEHLLQQDYYKELLDVQSCGLMAYTLPGHKIVHMNAEALRMYGYEKISDVQANIGAIISGFYYPDPEAPKKLSNLRKNDGVVDYEFVIRKGMEDECHAMAKTKRFISPSGEKLVVTTFVDVSDMIMLQHALERAEEGSKAKSTFLFNMSHDLRTPMNAIIGYADLMDRHWGEKEITTGYLKKLRAASRFLLSLINNVLEMARIESGKEILHETVCNVYETNKTIDAILEGALREKKLKFVRNVSIQHENIIGDPLKTNEIFLNIFSNAIKYTPEGGKITVDVEEFPSEREGYINIRTKVTDTGIGIGKEYIPHLFESFSRERNSSESGIIGTGLGLPIVKSLIDMMGGTINVDSELGKGTRFEITLCHKLAEIKNEQEESLKEEKEVEKLLTGKKVLLVEDNELNIEIAKTILEDIKMKVDVATDGEVALKCIKRVPADYYDLVLMDIQMPRMNGYQVTGEIRKLPDERANVPIVAMTANAFEEDRKAAFDAGMNDHIAKPIEIEKLMKTLAGIFG